MTITRTTTLAAVAAGALLLAGCSSAASSHNPSAHGTTAPLGSVAPATAASGTQPAAELASTNGKLDVTLTAAESQVPYAGTTRWAMTYNGAATGPTLRVHPGDTVTVNLVNNLTKPTSLHTHGLHVSPNQDNPFSMVAAGQTLKYTYTIPADQQAGTYWYHPHVHESTAEQVASGLSGAIIVENDTDTALAKVSTDRVLVANDPPLVRENPWGTGEGSGSMMGDGSGSMMGDGSGSMMGDGSGSMMGDRSESMMGSGSSGVDMMTAMMGRTGPRLLTNGTDGVALTGSGGLLERAHVVNATASTTLTLTYTGAKMLALSATGGRLAAPREVTSITLAPGERTEVVLVPGPDGGQLLGQRHTNEGNGGPVGMPEVMATVAADAGTDASVLPVSLTANTRDLFAADVTVDRQRVITLDGHMNPTIDGQPFDANRIDLTAKKGTVEEWIIQSNSPMVHPIHLHTWPFQVKGQAGWTDVVNVPAYGQQVIRVAFDDFTGTTVLHCHILDHEDTGMMAVIKVA
jgi:FtsP/CotA-like multicopper oxidase with cupredoxin domain